MKTVEKGPHTALVPEGVSPTSPVVVLLGWAGATDRPLSKFAEMLAEEGLISVRCVQPVSYLFAPVAYFRRSFAISLLDFLEEQQLCPPRPIVLYAFSNGGATVVEQIQSLVETTARYKRYQQLIVGFVFDSAPAYMRQEAAYQVLDVSMPPGLTKAAAKAAFTVSSWLAPMEGQRRTVFWDSMLRLGWGKPQLFLYSRDDPLCDADKLTELIEEKKSRGQRVTSFKWENSEHVAHFKVHRQQYLALLLPFLRALQLPPGSTAAYLSKL